MRVISVNTRTTSAQLTGVQRYTIELVSRMNGLVHISPSRPLQGVAGHLWEQVILPRQSRGTLLWSPANTGPLSVESQIVTIHDMSTFDHPEWMGRRFGQWYRFLTPKLATRVQRILTVSEFTKLRIVQCCGVPAEKISVIYNGVSSSFKPVSSHELDGLVFELKLPSRRYVLALGSLEPRKNLSRLVAAWQNIHAYLSSDTWLVIAGGKGSERVFRDLPEFKNLPRVFFTGYVADRWLPALYSGALCSAYVSLYEGFGLPVVEAMAAGAPMLVSETTSLPEVGGEAVLTADPLSVEDISFKLKALIDSTDLREQLRQKGFVRAERFNWDRAAAETMNILQKEAEQ